MQRVKSKSFPVNVENNNHDYSMGKIVKSRENGLIVLCSGVINHGSFGGQVQESGKSAFSVGHYNTLWKISSFYPYYGEIVHSAIEV